LALPVRGIDRGSTWNLDGGVSTGTLRRTIVRRYSIDPQQFSHNRAEKTGNRFAIRSV
jgi:hypothetical protein